MSIQFVEVVDCHLSLSLFSIIIFIVNSCCLLFVLLKVPPFKELSIDIQFVYIFKLLLLSLSSLLLKEAPSKELEMMTMIILVNVCITKNVVYFVYFFNLYRNIHLLLFIPPTIYYYSQYTQFPLYNPFLFQKKQHKYNIITRANTFGK